MIGATIGSYEVTGKLGEGGMGEVWRARDEKLGRDVALKLLPEQVEADSERLSRFEREAKVLASLNHPNIAHLYGLETAQRVRSGADGHAVTFLVMELVEGEDLSQRIEREPVPVDEAIPIALQMAQALEAAHERGIVHRDLKPSNVKLRPDGTVKVLDFGLAKAWESDDGDPVISLSPTITKNQTAAGVILGTAAYMSPDQARGKPVDRRADIWAYGVVLWEMLTGRKLFEGDTVTDVLASVLKETPDLEALPDSVPVPLRRLVARCLEKDPRRRLQAIGEARIVLEGPMDEPPEEAASSTGASDAPPTRSVRLWQAAAALLLIAAAAFAWLALRSTPQTRQVIRADIPAPDGTAFDLDPGGPGAVAVSPDGTQMVFSARDEAGQILLWVRRLSDSSARPLPGTEDGAYPFWSPNGRSIAFFSGDAKLRRVDVAGGPPVTICPAPNGKGGSWSDDGRILFTPAHNTPIQVVDAAGGEPRDATELREGETGHRFPVWLSDGRFLYLARARAGEEADRIRVGSVEGSDDDRELLAAASNAVPVSGRLLFIREGNLMAQPFDTTSAKLMGDAVPIADDILYISGARLGVFSASRNGVLVFQGGSVDTETELVWFDREGTEIDQLGDGVRHRDIQLSPDGRFAAAEILDDQSGASDVWVYDLARRLRTRFTFDPTMDWWPVWSPDGSRLAFSSIRDGSNNLWVKEVGGADEEQLLFKDDEAELGAAAWSPDGRHLVFARFNTQDWDIYALDLESDEATAVIASSFREWLPELSPDGRWLAYASTESGRPEVYVTTFPDPGRRWQVSTAGGEFPRWGGDGSELFFVAPDGHLMAAEIDGRSDTLIVGELESLFSWPRASGFRYPYAVASGDDRFLVNRAVSSEQAFPLTLVYNWDAELENR